MDPLSEPTRPRYRDLRGRAAGVRASHRLGQRFLVDPRPVTRTALALAEFATAPVLEVGAGTGQLTAALAAGHPLVVAVEVDPALAERLAASSGDRVEVWPADIRRVDLDRVVARHPGQWLVAGNLPYYLTTPLLLRLVQWTPTWGRMIFMVQREVGDRLVAEPGTPAYGALSVVIQYHRAVRMLQTVPPQWFSPRGVASALIQLDPVPPPVPVPWPVLEPLVRAAFGHRRKTLANAVALARPDLDRGRVAASCQAAGIDPRRRGETLSLAEFHRLSRELA